MLEVQSLFASARPVDKPDDKPILVSMDHVVKCSPELPEVSWLGKEKGQRGRPRRALRSPRKTKHKVFSEELNR